MLRSRNGARGVERIRLYFALGPHPRRLCLRGLRRSALLQATIRSVLVLGVPRRERHEGDVRDLANARAGILREEPLAQVARGHEHAHRFAFLRPDARQRTPAGRVVPPFPPEPGRRRGVVETASVPELDDRRAVPLARDIAADAQRVLQAPDPSWRDDLGPSVRSLTAIEV